MSDLSDRILAGLDDALIAEVGARFRQASTNDMMALPNHFEPGLQKLKAMHAQAQALVSKTFGDAKSG